MSRLFVTGAGTDIGKTYTACLIIEALRARGRAVDALKPLVSGFDETNSAGSDPALLLRALGREVNAAEIARIAPWRYRAPLAPNMAARLEGRRVSFDDVATLCRERTGDPLVIEGAGGVMSPVDDAHTFLDLIVTLSAPCILVVGTYLGAISHTLTALATLSARGAPPSCVIVSESAGSDVSLAETAQALRDLAPGAAIESLQRGGQLADHTVDLIAAI